MLGGETMYYLIITLSLVLAGQLEVDGSLKVSEGIDADGETISNVGNAVSDSDATNLSTVRSMLGMKPERIYSFVKTIDGGGYSAIVPEEKIWKITFFSEAWCSTESFAINDEILYFYYYGQSTSFHGSEFWLTSGNNIASVSNNCSYVINIFEYPISDSGTDQGMDYIVP